ncbi:hypothetical protein DL768_010325 [Monosporascus sp. mg162]|nr:hypothetical protein DL768_010325 [Monosporascus sp. mg162]
MAAAKGTIIVTGANGGLGSAIVKQIISSPELSAYHGLYTVRNAVSAPGLRSVLEVSQSHSFDVVSLDLANLDSVRQAASSINDRVAAGEIPPIRALILNAGCHEYAMQTWTADGLDTCFASNYLGHWLLTLFLLKSMDREVGRVVAIGSQAHDPYDDRNKSGKAFEAEKWKTIFPDADDIDPIAKGTWSTVKDDPSWRSGFRRYGASKLCLVMMMDELQRRLDTDPVLKNICVLAVDPGTMSTGLARHAPWFIRILMFKIVFPLLVLLKPNGTIRSPGKSAADVLAAAFDSSPVLGQYPKGVYLNGSEPAETSAESRDVRKRVLLWKESLRYTHLQKEETILVNWD